MARLRQNRARWNVLVQACSMATLLAASFGAAPVHAQACDEIAHLLASDAGPNDNFGWSVSISGDTLIIGADRDDNEAGFNAGAGYVFIRSGPPGQEVWTQQQKLTASDAAASDRFGYSVSVSGDTAIVGAIWDDTAAGTDSGSAYVFTRSGGVWTQQQKLAGSDTAAGDWLGFSVCISGDSAIVGANLDNTTAGADNGSAYVFTRSGGLWTQQQKLTTPDGAFGDQVGFSVSIDGDSAIVGAVQDDTVAGADVGSAYVFARSAGVWTLQQKLTASDGAASDLAGHSVSISGDTAILGAPGDEIAGGPSNAGSAYVFTRTGGVWTQQQRIAASDGAANDNFGIGVSISGDSAIVGAYRDDTAAGADVGAAYVFTRAGNVWTQQQKLTPSQGTSNDFFGWGVSISGDAAIVGADRDETAAGSETGSAYVFECAGRQIIGDVDGDGDVDVDDLIAVILGWGPCPAPPALCPADVAPVPDGDGEVDVDDLITVILNWG